MRNLAGSLQYIWQTSRRNCGRSQVGKRPRFPSEGDTRTGLYTWLVSPEQEQQVCDALVNLGPVDTEQGLHAEGVRTIQEVLHCSLDDARAALGDLRLRKRVQETTAPNKPDGPQSPLSFSWVRPPR
jgi:hypothetical protein